MSDLVIVEASGKIDALRKKLKSILGADVSVIATVGHLADNPSALDDIALDEDLRELRYRFKQERGALIEKIRRETFASNRVWLAMDADDEGDVIAYDVSRCLPEFEGKLVRVRLRSLSDSDLKQVFSDAHAVDRNDLLAAANNGICRRIVDRAIGATFTKMSADGPIPVGRVQSALLACIDKDLPEIGSFVIRTKLFGLDCVATVPVHTLDECEKIALIAQSLSADSSKIVIKNVSEEEVSVSNVWAYEDIVAKTSERLHIGIEDAADALQTAYERCKVSYPRAGKDGFMPDAVEVAAALARENRSAFDGRRLPLFGGAGDKSAHASPSIHDEYMPLGLPLSLMGAPDAVATLVARNLIECGQTKKIKRVVCEFDGMQIEFTANLSRPMCNWKATVSKDGYTPHPQDVALLKYMSSHGLGRASTIVGHVVKFLDRGLINNDGSNMALTGRGKEWLSHANQCGLTLETSRMMDRMFKQNIGDANQAALSILKRAGMDSAVLNCVRKQASGHVSNVENVF